MLFNRQTHFFNRLLSLSFLMIALLVTSCISNEERAKTALVKDVNWIKGSWSGQQRQENWRQISGQSIHGKSIVMKQGDTLSASIMQIAKPEDKIEFKIRKKESDQVSTLELTSLGDQRAVFTNKEGSSPKSVIYKKQGNTLEVILEKADGEQSFEMTPSE